MKNSQIYFIHQCQVQNYNYNTTEESREFSFQNLLCGFPYTLDILGVWRLLFKGGAYGSAQLNQRCTKITIKHNKFIKLLWYISASDRMKG